MKDQNTPSGLRIILKGEIMVNLPVIVVLILCTILLMELGVGSTLAVIIATGAGWFVWDILLEKWKRWALSKGVERERLYKLGKLGLINFYKYRIFDDENASKNSDNQSKDSSPTNG